MLSPKEMAKSIVYKYIDILFEGQDCIYKSRLIKCATSEVEAIISSHGEREWMEDRNLTNIVYWEQVKNEIINL